jgi:hypothetical protein
MSAFVTALKGKELGMFEGSDNSLVTDETFSMGRMVGKRRSGEENQILIFSVLRF